MSMWVLYAREQCLAVLHDACTQISLLLLDDDDDGDENVKARQSESAVTADIFHAIRLKVSL